MGPRVLLPLELVALLVALAGAASIGPTMLGVFACGAIAGAVVALAAAWHAMTPNFRLLVRAAFQARLRAER